MVKSRLLDLFRSQLMTEQRGVGGWGKNTSDTKTHANDQRDSSTRELSQSSTSSDVKKRICVVGCGPAGMSILYHFGNLPAAERPDIVCYEKQSTWGGMWNVSWRTGTDEYGEHVHSCMYYDLWTNSPKEIIEYPDYTFEKHFGGPVPSYLPWDVVRNYIGGRFFNTGKRDLLQNVHFSTVVRWVEYNKDTDDFTVKVKHLEGNKHTQERFTHVIVATGLFGTSYTPFYPGVNDFKGRILHAKDVRHSNEFKDQRVLIIGSWLSAQDLALQFLKFGSKNIIISYKTAATKITWPPGVEERPRVKKLEESSVLFIDGTSAEIDSVIFCTGYKLYHPFLPEDLRMKPDMSIYPDNLYKGIVWMKGGNMKLLYIGVQYATFFLHILDIQALWACRFIIGAEQVPAREDMLKDTECMTEKRDAIDDSMKYERLTFVTEYLMSLAAANGSEPFSDKAEELLLEDVQNKREDICTYRDKQFKSIHTGQMSTAPTTPWMKSFKNSPSDFLTSASNDISKSVFKN